MSIALPIPLPMNELCRNVALEGKTSTTTAKTVWRIMCRNQTYRAGGCRKKRTKWRYVIGNKRWHLGKITENRGEWARTELKRKCDCKAATGHKGEPGMPGNGIFKERCWNWRVFEALMRSVPPPPPTDPVKLNWSDNDYCIPDPIEA